MDNDRLPDRTTPYRYTGKGERNQGKTPNGMQRK
jgi:hypothetical protein